MDDHQHNTDNELAPAPVLAYDAQPQDVSAEPATGVLTTASPGTPKQRRMPLGLSIFLVTLALFVIAAAGAYVYATSLLEPVDEEAIATVEFEVMPGWGASRIADALLEEELIQSALVFKLLLRYLEQDRNLGEGLYDLSPAMSMTELIEALIAGGRPRVVRIVIPEGWRAYDVALRLANNNFGNLEELTRLVSEPSERPDFVPEGVGLEGYLFPASYDIPVRSSAEDVIKMMLARFEAELTDEVVAELEARSLSVHEWVTLASMIQSEAGALEEMPIISGVFHNRLDDAMLLQSDPTVAYGLGKRLPELSRSAGDFTMAADHAWNTYTRPGLPITAISSPGHEALQAVFAPQRLNEDGQSYYYFLHTPEGQFLPNLTLADHNRDVQTYLR